MLFCFCSNKQYKSFPEQLVRYIYLESALFVICIQFHFQRKTFQNNSNEQRTKKKNQQQNNSRGYTVRFTIVTISANTKLFIDLNVIEGFRVSLSLSGHSNFRYLNKHNPPIQCTNKMIFNQITKILRKMKRKLI